MFERESSAWKPNAQSIVFWENKFIFKSQEVPKSIFLHIQKKNKKLWLKHCKVPKIIIRPHAFKTVVLYKLCQIFGSLIDWSPKCNRPKKRGGGGVYSPMEDLYIVTYINIPETKINRKGNSV